MRQRLSNKEARAFTRAAYRFWKYKCDRMFFTKIPRETVAIGQTRRRKIFMVKGFYECDGKEEIIKIDYRYDIVATIIHETLHAIHEKWTEREVRKEERRLLKGLSEKQILNLLRRFLSYI